jgi:UPF0716 protein FxsA
VLKFLILLIFIGVPIAEIAMFIKVGDVIGLWPTLATIIATAVAGTAILRAQGIAVLAKAQQSMDEGQLPIDSVVHGLFLLIAGVLLLTPGFLTDAVGFLLLVPPARLAFARWVLKQLRQSPNVRFHRLDMGGRDEKTTGEPRSGPIIEGEVIRDDDEGRRGDDGSPWRQ